MAPKRADRDSLDDSLAIWAREIPDLDPVTEGIIERIQTLAFNVNQSMEETLASHELDRRSFQLLGKLRRHGAPYRVAAGKLATELRLSSGAMTNRLDRMESAGLIRRVPDPTDRRGTLIEPTDAGHRAWDKTVGEAARREASFTSVLSEAEKVKLHDLLRALLTAFPNWEHKKDVQHEAQAVETAANRMLAGRS
jgi:DNA-binding MarR family transcriptional regulator